MIFYGFLVVAKEIVSVSKVTHRPTHGCIIVSLSNYFEVGSGRCFGRERGREGGREGGREEGMERIITFIDPKLIHCYKRKRACMFKGLD